MLQAIIQGRCCNTEMKESRNNTIELNYLAKSRKKGGYLILLHYGIFQSLFLFSMQN
jgi:hypothetical protein